MKMLHSIYFFIFFLACSSFSSTQNHEILDSIHQKKTPLGSIAAEDSAFSSEDDERPTARRPHFDTEGTLENLEDQIRILDKRNKRTAEEIDTLSTIIMKRGAVVWGIPFYPDPKETLSTRDRMNVLKELQEWLHDNGHILPTKELSKAIKDGSSHLAFIKRDTGNATPRFLSSFEPKWEELKEELRTRKTQKNPSQLSKEEALSILRNLETLELQEELDLTYRQLIKTSKRLKLFEHLNHQVRGSIGRDFKNLWQRELTGFMMKFKTYQELRENLKKLQNSGFSS